MKRDMQKETKREGEGRSEKEKEKEKEEEIKNKRLKEKKKRKKKEGCINIYQKPAKYMNILYIVSIKCNLT